MDACSKDLFRELRGLRADLRCPPDESFRRPLLVKAMLWWHVLAHRGMSALGHAALVAGDPFAPIKAFDDGRGHPDIQLFFDQPAGNAVIMAVDFKVIINVDRGLLPLGKLVGDGG